MFSGALIKKQRNWTKYINGEKTKARFSTKQVGTCDAWQRDLDRVNFQVHTMKEPYYTMMMVTTYRTLKEKGTVNNWLVEENITNTKVDFQYPEIIHNHFKYRDTVDAHHSSCMHLISLEKTWKTTKWPLQVLTFFLQS